MGGWEDGRIKSAAFQYSNTPILQHKNMDTIQLADYSILVGDIRKNLPAYLQQKKYSRLVIICDDNTERDCLPNIEKRLGDSEPIIVRIPPGVMHGFKCISENEAIVLNCPTELYNREEPDEFRLPAHTDKIPYDWDRKDG